MHLCWEKKTKRALCYLGFGAVENRGSPRFLKRKKRQVHCKGTPAQRQRRSWGSLGVRLTLESRQVQRPQDQEQELLRICSAVVTGQLSHTPFWNFSLLLTPSYIFCSFTISACTEPIRATQDPSGSFYCYSISPPPPSSPPGATSLSAAPGSNTQERIVMTHHVCAQLMEISLPWDTCAPWSPCKDRGHTGYFDLAPQCCSQWGNLGCNQIMRTLA